LSDVPNPLIEQVLAGENRRLQQLAAAGVLPLPLEQLIALQVHIARGPDQELAEQARNNLRELEPRVAVPYLERDAGPREIAFFAREADHPRIIEAILRRRDVPRAILIDLAGRLPGEMQEILLLRQDAILDEPEILAALERNPQLTAYSQRRVIEYRQHLLPQRFGDRAAIAEMQRPSEVEEATEEEVAQAIQVVQAAPPIGDIDEHTGLSEGQVRMLPVPVRIRLSRNCTRVMKTILLRDTSTQVALSVLRNNNFSESELEQVARSRVVIEEVLDAIGRRREWVGKYSVARALVGNPRSQIAMSLRLMSRLSVRDLRTLARDRNVSDAVRSNAQRLYTIKQQ
jgi:hypothetical protein